MTSSFNKAAHKVFIAIEHLIRCGSTLALEQFAV